MPLPPPSPLPTTSVRLSTFCVALIIFYSTCLSRDIETFATPLVPATFFLVASSSHLRVRYPARAPQQPLRKLQGLAPAHAGQPRHSRFLSAEFRPPEWGVASISGVKGTLQNGHVFCLCATPTPFVLLALVVVMPLMKTHNGVTRE